MNNFKVGDKIKNIDPDTYRNNTGKTGIIVRIEGNDCSIEYEDGATGCGDKRFYQLINNNNQTIMTKALEFYRNITASAEEKLLKKFGLEDPIGTPTAEGLALAQEILYKQTRNQIIDIAKEMEAEEIKAKK